MSQRVKTSARGLVLPRSSSPENDHLRKNTEVSIVNITSPIVLIEKRAKSSEPKASDRESSLRQYRFCVDYRYLSILP
jgi:hypothetical protein